MAAGVYAALPRGRTYPAKRFASRRSDTPQYTAPARIIPVAAPAGAEIDFEEPGACETGRLVGPVDRASFARMVRDEAISVRERELDCRFRQRA